MTVELAEVLRRRRSIRAFRSDPLPEGMVEDMVAAALRAPSAGNTDGWAFVALEGREQTSRYWDVTLPLERRDSFPWPGLLDAPALVLPLCRPDAWVTRYGEPDKVRSGLGAGTDAWSVPYWWVDTAFAAMLAQLAAVGAGLGTCFFGLFDHEDAVLAALGVPPGWRAIGTIAVGWPDPERDRASRSVQRGRPDVSEVLHREGWSLRQP